MPALGQSSSSVDRCPECRLAGYTANDWDVLGLERVLENAQITHEDVISAYEKERHNEVAVAIGSPDSKSKPEPRAAAKKSASKTAPAPSASRRKR